MAIGGWVKCERGLRTIIVLGTIHVVDLESVGKLDGCLGTQCNDLHSTWRLNYANPSVSLKKCLARTQTLDGPSLRCVSFLPRYYRTLATWFSVLERPWYPKFTQECAQTFAMISRQEPVKTTASAELILGAKRECESIY